MHIGQEIFQRAEALGAMTEVPGEVTRTYLTPMAKKAGEQIIAWMREAGMDEAGWDALGNVVGRYYAQGDTCGANSPVVMTGSHMDSVVNAGKYDGLFGILSPIACVKQLHQHNQRLPFTFEIVAFGDEEGVRFGITLIGSKAMAGRFDDAWWDKTDSAGISLRQAVIDFGGNPDAVSALTRDRQRYLAYIESHIEQGPVLLNAGLAVGVVSAIAGATRVMVRVQGLAGHAGTVPMRGRQDALTAAAEMILSIEKYCLDRCEQLVGTVGKIEVRGGGAMNVIPAEVSFSIDVRSGQDIARQSAVRALQDACGQIAQARNVTLQWDAFYQSNAAPCDNAQQTQWANAIAALDITPMTLPSGAGHDAMSFAGVLPLSMLFVRCGNGGISHNPLETMTAQDAEIATQTMLYFFTTFSGVVAPQVYE